MLLYGLLLCCKKYLDDEENFDEKAHEINIENDENGILNAMAKQNAQSKKAMNFIQVPNDYDLVSNDIQSNGAVGSMLGNMFGLNEMDESFSDSDTNDQTY